MFHRRETGSVVLPVPREEVYRLLLRSDAEEGVAIRVTENERLEFEKGAARSTFVLRDMPGGGTRLIAARAVRPGLRSLFQQPEGLREEVEADLFRIQQLAGALRH